MQTLKGRTCVFAGASGGDGVDAVKALCKGGMNVIMMTHNAARAQALVEEVNGMGFEGKCAAVGATDQGPAEHDPATYEALAKEYGSVDVIISNTGAQGHGTPMEEVTSEELLQEVDHLVNDAFATMKAALPTMRATSKAPRIIFMTSVEGVSGGVHGSFCNAVGKGAVDALAKNAAARLAKEGITVNSIAKGGITRYGGSHPGDADPADYLPAIPMNRLATPEDLAQLICFLASEESAYITGQTIALDGGLRLRA